MPHNAKTCENRRFVHFPQKTANDRHFSKYRQILEKKVFYAFSAVSFNNPATHYKIFTKYKKNSILHTFPKPNAEKCENKAFEVYFGLFNIMCEICTLCKIIRKCAKTLFCREFSRIVRKSCKTAIWCVLLWKLQIVDISRNNNKTWENKVFCAFSAFSFNNPSTFYEIITKPKKNSVLHAFWNIMQKKCENKAFEVYFDLFNIMCEICTLCKIIRKCSKTLCCRAFSRSVRKSWKTALWCVLLWKLHIVDISRNNDKTWENKVFCAFSAFSFNNPSTFYEIITKPKKKSVLHAFWNIMHKPAKPRYWRPISHFSLICAMHARYAQ